MKIRFCEVCGFESDNEATILLTLQDLKTGKRITEYRCDMCALYVASSG